MLTFDDIKKASQTAPEKQSLPFSAVGGIRIHAGKDTVPPLPASAAKAVTFMGGIKPVAQRFASIKKLPKAEPAAESLKMDYVSDRPTMIYESMTKHKSDAEKIFMQSKLYHGNTICVVGMNQRDPDDVPADSPRHAVEDVNDRDERLGGYVHSLKSFKFVWRKPRDVPEDQQYKMPYIEARLAVMKEAKAIAENVRASIPKKPNKDPLSSPMSCPLFRWIDADARDDSSGNVSAKVLRALAKGNKNDYNVISGSYKWRSEYDLSNHPLYSTLLDKINEAEKKIRDEFFKSLGKTAETSYEYPTANGLNEDGKFTKPNHADASSFSLPQYYLPETTLLMSENAHDIILKGGEMFTMISSLYTVCYEYSSGVLDIDKAKSEFAKIGTEGLPTDLAECVGNDPSTTMTDEKIKDLKEKIDNSYKGYIQPTRFNYRAAQDKESMRLLQLAQEYISVLPSDSLDTLSGSERWAKENGVDLNSSTYHSENLTVTKPLKREFEEGTSNEPNYLGEDFLKLLRLGEQADSEGEDEEEKEKRRETHFVNCLKQLRQNVFQRFEQAQNSTMNDFINDQIRDIYDWYKSNAPDLRTELATLPTQRTG